MSIENFKDRLYQMIDSYANRITQLNIEHEMLDHERLQIILIELEAEIEKKLQEELKRRTLGTPGGVEEHR